MDSSQETLQKVQEYYGETLNGTQDLKTGACCTAESLPAHHREILAKIDDEILTKFYGCGSPIPEAIEGKTVLDLGCGTGRDVYLAAALVGRRGKVIGIDMTESQLAVARKHVRKQMAAFGFARPNVDFRKGFIEDLARLGIEDNSVDVVISNCVLNLSPDKERVFSEIFRVLRPGGELYFSDVFSDRRIPEPLRNDPLLYGECLSGALYTEDFRRLLRKIGILDYRIVSRAAIDLQTPEIKQKVGMINFYSVTVRAFKLDSLEDICEDYGQVAIYQGTIPEMPHAFVLDDHHTFFTGKPKLVCGNTAAMLQETRLAEHFSLLGNRSTHFGAFDCGPSVGGEADEPAACGC